VGYYRACVWGVSREGERRCCVPLNASVHESESFLLNHPHHIARVHRIHPHLHEIPAPSQPSALARGARLLTNNGDASHLLMCLLVPSHTLHRCPVHTPMTHRSAGHHIFCRRWLDFLLDNSLLRTGENWTSPPADVRVSGCANTSSWVLRLSPTVFWDTTSYRARAAPLTHRRATPQCGRTGDTLGLPHAPAPHARRSKTLSCMCSDTAGRAGGEAHLDQHPVITKPGGAAEVAALGRCV